MTNLNATASHQPETACNRHGPQAAASFLAFLGHLVHAYRSRRDAEHLASLSDYLLKDIGITRSAIPDVVDKGRPPL